MLVGILFIGIEPIVEMCMASEYVKVRVSFDGPSNGTQQTVMEIHQTDVYYLTT